MGEKPALMPVLCIELSVHVHTHIHTQRQIFAIQSRGLLAVTEDTRCPALSSSSLRILELN